MDKVLTRAFHTRSKQPEPLQQVILRLSLAHDIDEAQNLLFSLSEKEVDK